MSLPKSFWPAPDGGFLCHSDFLLPDHRGLHALAGITGNAQQTFFVSNVGDLKSYYFSAI
jgi:hypothetical protein